MALAAPIRSSTGNLPFDFERINDMSENLESESYKPSSRVVSSPPTTDANSLRPNSANRIYSSPANVLSPSDLVGPSPVTSNGTETTEIEDEESEEVYLAHNVDSIAARQSQLLMLSTNLPDSVRQASNEEAVSVIHAPESFTSWTSTEPTARQSQPSDRGSPENDQDSFNCSRPKSMQPERPPISTDVKPVRYSVDSATPRAQDLQDMMGERSRLRSSSTSSLEKIEEQTEAEGDDDDDYEKMDPFAYPGPTSHGEKIDQLWKLLQNCWGVCNSLAGLGAFPARDKLSSRSGSADSYQRAWRACWKLCARLYDNETGPTDLLSVREMLDLSRDFCQSLFDVRVRADLASDSVLRVSFELNNHLYSAQDSRNLPEEFRERTLDFYITLCHRLMKQRAESEDDDTGMLLRACWGLTEMLFSLRQSRREGRAADEELLGLAIQACCELSDVFRLSWSQSLPERNTPRPTQVNFSQQSPEPSGRDSRASNRSSSYSKREGARSSQKEERARKQVPPPPPSVPETPVTEFEDTPISPGSRSPQMPNIMVLGPTSEGSRGGRWSSSASNLSNYSHSSNRTSSTATTTTATEDPNVTRAKLLVLRAAMNMGFNRDNITDIKTGTSSFKKFVSGLPTGSFGPLATHTTLLQQYKDSVVNDGFMARSHTLTARNKRVSAQDIAKSVHAMINNSSSRYGYLRELYKFVFQFPLEEADSRKHVSIQI